MPPLSSILLTLAGIVVTALVQVGVSWIFRVAVEDVKAENSSLKEELRKIRDEKITVLESGQASVDLRVTQIESAKNANELRLQNLEAKDLRDIRSRAEMHKEIEQATQEMRLLGERLALARSAIPSLEMIRAEIDRSIRAGEARVQALQNDLRAYDESRLTDAKHYGERIASLESWRKTTEESA